MRNSIPKIGLIAFIGLLAVFAFKLGLSGYITFEFLKNNLLQMKALVGIYPLQAILGFFTLYVLITAFSIPAATVLTLFGGAIFGLVKGVIIVALASTTGATLAFLASRFLLSDYVSRKFSAQIKVINENIEKEGIFYLLTMRLLPIFPFFMINLGMGVTSIRTSIFFIVSFIGMLPAIIFYVLAGQEFSEINSLKEILSPKFFALMFALGIFTYSSKFLVNWIKRLRLYKKFKKPSSFDYNMIVIGGGSAGLMTSYIAATVKARVALIEKEKMGGDCLNHGCVPSKALIKSAKAIHARKKAGILGIKKIDIEFEFMDVMSRIKRIIYSIEPHDSKERYAELGVDCISGAAKILSPYEVQVGNKIYTTQNITIATGAKPLIPSIKGIENSNFITSDTIWELRELPERFLVIGGGAVGLEMAQCFCRLGSKVTIIETGSRILSREDHEVSILLQKILIEEGIQIHTDLKPLEFSFSNQIHSLLCESPAGLVKIDYDAVLLATGRKANVSGFGLEELNIAIRKNGTIETNEFLETKYPNIFACGDVTGPYQLTHMAAYQSWYCAINGLFGKFRKFRADYKAVPWCIFTDPEVATVGINEEEAKRLALNYEVTIYHLSDLDRAITEDETAGFVKIITGKGTDKILGTTIVGSIASTMILEFITAIKFNIGLKKIQNTIHIYPSMGEANKYAAGVWRKEHAPAKILNLMGRYFSWTRK